MPKKNKNTSGLSAKLKEQRMVPAQDCDDEDFPDKEQDYMECEICGGTKNVKTTDDGYWICKTCQAEIKAGTINTKYVQFKVGKMFMNIPKSKLHAAKVNEREALALLKDIAKKHLEKEGPSYVLTEFYERLVNMAL